MLTKHTFLFTLVIGIAWTGYLFAFSLGPDPASNGVFGDTKACATSGCHVGTNNLNPSTGSLTLSGLPATWTPSQTYPLTITVQRTGTVRFGFQLSAVTDTGNQQAGTLATGGTNQKVVTSAGVQFVEHSSASSVSTWIVNWTAPSSASAGKVRFNLAANAANGDFNNTGDFIYTKINTIDPAAATTSQTLYFPQVANGVLGAQTWKTTIFLTNPASTGTASGTITFTKESATLSDAGSPFNLNFTDETGQSASGGNQIAFQIAAGQSHKYTSAGTGTYAGGFATVTSNATVGGTAVFSSFNSAGALTGEAGVPAAAAVTRQAIFVDTQGGFNIGLAYVNPGSSAASVTLSLFNAAGMSAAAPATQTIGPGNHKAVFMSELFPGVPQMAGTMQITSQSQLAAIALRFDPTFTFFTTLPPVTLASLINPAVEWLEQRPWLTPFTSLAKLLGSLQFKLG